MQVSGRYTTERLCKQNALSSPKTTKKFLQAESGKGSLLHWNEEKKRLKTFPEVWGEGSNFHCRGGGAAGEMETHSLEKEARESMSGCCATMPGFKYQALIFPGIFAWFQIRLYAAGGIWKKVSRSSLTVNG